MIHHAPPAGLVVGNRVAIIVSREHGAGWSTWCYDPDMANLMLTDKFIAVLLMENQQLLDTVYQKSEQQMEEYLEFERDNFIAIREHCDEVYGRHYTELAIGNLEVEWVPADTAFQIRENDGRETVVYRDTEEWLVFDSDNAHQLGNLA